MEGDFATGTWFSMRLPDNELIRTQLIDVVTLQRFVDETWIGATVIRVEHRLEALAADRCRVVYAVSATGPDAATIAPAVSADFPEVLAGLEQYLGRLAAV